MALSVTPLTGSVGARVDGVDLDALSEDSFETIRQVFFDHSVLVFRGQYAKPARAPDRITLEREILGGAA